MKHNKFNGKIPYQFTTHLPQTPSPHGEISSFTLFHTTLYFDGTYTVLLYKHSICMAL